jgi:Gon7 family
MISADKVSENRYTTRVIKADVKNLNFEDHLSWTLEILAANRPNSPNGLHLANHTLIHLASVQDPMATDERNNENALAARYRSPTGMKDFTHGLSAKCSPKATVSETTAYLSELRSGTKTMQENINKFLTEKMEEDKTREASTKSTKTKGQDEVEEENYGEEPAEED